MKLRQEASRCYFKNQLSEDDSWRTQSIGEKARDKRLFSHEKADLRNKKCVTRMLNSIAP